MTAYLSNAISLAASVRPENWPYNLRVEAVNVEEARRHAASAISRVGHADIAEELSEALGVPVSVCREPMVLEKGDQVLMRHYVGPRLPEGVRVRDLPKDHPDFRWILVTAG